MKKSHLEAQCLYFTHEDNVFLEEDNYILRIVLEPFCRIICGYTNASESLQSYNMGSVHFLKGFQILTRRHIVIPREMFCIIHSSGLL